MAIPSQAQSGREEAATVVHMQQDPTVIHPAEKAFTLYPYLPQHNSREKLYTRVPHLAAHRPTLAHWGLYLAPQVRELFPHIIARNVIVYKCKQGLKC